ncbi:MAG TPA: hypothetical protein VFY71_08080 [Planctomycetota bacterium]|nr:hypothetical protein [Planctomycetota bacterium]
MGRTMARDRLMLRVLPLVLAVTLSACGHQAAPTASEPWPITLQAKGVVAYAALRPPVPAFDDACTRLFGFVPAGVDASRPFTVMSLDAKAFGGAYALLLPLRDDAAFRDSLDKAPGLRHGGRGDYVLEVPADSELGRLILFSSSAVAGTGSFMDLVGAIQNAGPQSLAFQCNVEDGWALVAPTFEATSACRDVLRETGSFAGAPPRALVLGVDLDRVRTVYAAELKRMEDQFRALIGGAQAAGLLGMASGMHGGDRPALDFGVKWEFVWAVKAMFELSTFEGAQVALVQPGAAGDAGEVREAEMDGGRDSWRATLEGEAARFVRDLLAARQGVLRLRLAPGTPLAALVAALRPAPEMHDALVFATDGPAFGRAVADWMRPLGELAKGEGAPCDRYLDELASILASMGGTISLQVAGEHGCLMASGGGITPDSLQRLRTWATPILAAAGVDVAEDSAASLTTRELSGGRTLLVAADGSPRATLGRRGDIAWLCGGESDVPDAALTAFERALAAPPPDDAPCLRVRSEAFEADLRADGRELQLELRRTDDGR